jgi:hypothetical protein
MYRLPLVIVSSHTAKYVKGLSSGAEIGDTFSGYIESSTMGWRGHWDGKASGNGALSH